MKAALRDARVDAAVERARKPKPQRAVTPKPVKPSKYPRLAHNSATKGTLVVRETPRLRGTRAAIAKKPLVVGEAKDAKARGPLMPRRAMTPREIAKAMTDARRAGVRHVSLAAAQQKGTRTEAARAKKRAA